MSNDTKELNIWLKQHDKHYCTCNGKKLCKQCEDKENQYYIKEVAHE